MSKARVTIIGLGLLGNSIGLALSQGNRDFEIVGHDKSSDAGAQAKKLKAVDKTEWNLLSACDGAGLIILALPLNAIRDTLQALRTELQPGVVITHTASLQAPAQAWADELLPAGVSFVGGHPIVAGNAASDVTASGELFNGGAWAICPSATTDADAVQMVSDLAERLGAKPLYLDPVEHDGMIAAVEHVPALLGLALLDSVVKQPAWHEMRRLAGAPFEAATQVAFSDAASFSATLLSDPQQSLRVIDRLIDALRVWREGIAAGETQPLEDAFDQTIAARERWLKQQQSKEWNEGDRVTFERPKAFGSLLNFGRSTERRSGTRR